MSVQKGRYLVGYTPPTVLVNEFLAANTSVNQDGNVPLNWVVIGPQQEDVSYGQQPDRADTWNFLTPLTPGANNG